MNSPMEMGVEKRRDAPLHSRQNFALVMAAAFFGTVHQSSLGQRAVTGSRWAALMITLLAALGFAALSLYILKKGDGRPLPDMVVEMLPGWAGTVVLGTFLLGQILYAALEVRYQSEGIAAFMLEKTPLDVIMIALLVSAAALLQRGFRQLKRVSCLLFWVILLPVAAVLIMAALQMDWGELRVLTAVNGKDLLTEMRETAGLIFNLQLILFFEGYSPRGRNGILWGTTAAMMIQMVFLAVLVGVFTLAGTSKLHLPIAELIRVTNAAPYSLFERLDVFFLATRTMLVVLNITLWMFAAASCLKSLGRLANIRSALLPVAVVIFGAAMLGQQTALQAVLQKLAGAMQWIICVGLIPLLALVLWIRERRRWAA